MNKTIESFLETKKKISIETMRNYHVDINNLLKKHDTNIIDVTDNQLVRILLNPNIKDFNSRHLSSIKQLQKYVSLVI